MAMTENEMFSQNCLPIHPIPTYYRTCVNMLKCFQTATKYSLRYQPGYDYPDLQAYIQNLPTYAKLAHQTDGPLPKKRFHPIRRAAQSLGVAGTQSNPRKHLKKLGPKYLGHLPLEILQFVSAYVQMCMTNGTCPAPIVQTQILTAVGSLVEALTGMERVSKTPLPLAYNIAISQITWAYILILPFQLVLPLGWIAIPGTLGTPPILCGWRLMIAAAYIILGIAAIGRELEDPFGTDVNDLDMEEYIRALGVELDIMTSNAPPKPDEFIFIEENYPFGSSTDISFTSAMGMSMDGASLEF